MGRGFGAQKPGRCQRGFRDYPVTLWDAVAGAQASGRSGDALVDAVLPELRKRYGEWGGFKHFARHNIDQTTAELRGTRKVPVPGGL